LADQLKKECALHHLKEMQGAFSAYEAADQGEKTLFWVCQ